MSRAKSFAVAHPWHPSPRPAVAQSTKCVSSETSAGSSQQKHLSAVLQDLCPFSQFVIKLTESNLTEQISTPKVIFFKYSNCKHTHVHTHTHAHTATCSAAGLWTALYAPLLIPKINSSAHLRPSNTTLTPTAGGILLERNVPLRPRCETSV